MASTQAKMIANHLDDYCELGSRSVVEQGRGSLYLCIHEIAVHNMEIDSGDRMVQHLDTENNRIVIEFEDRE